MVTNSNKWQLLATLVTNGDFFKFLHLLETLGNLWQIFAIFSASLLQSVTVSGSVLQSVTVSGSLVVVRAVCCSLWQSVVVNGSQLAVIANLYQPERRRREGQLRTPHDPMLAFSRIFSISRNSQTP